MPFFSHEQMPKYPGLGQPLDPDCCPKEACPQRDYNRAAVLTLENLTRAYASLMLLQHATAQLWSCDDQGHTADCPNPECRFGRERADDLIEVQLDLVGAINAAYRALSSPATDLTAQWQGLYDVEQAALGIRSLAEKIVKGTIHDRLGERMFHSYLTSWQNAAVGDDPDEWHRWFEPPDGDERA